MPFVTVEVMRVVLGFSVEEIVQPLPLAGAPLASFFGNSVPAGPDEPVGRLPVFLPRRVLDEAVESARQAGDVETGGVLVGKLRRDSGGHAAASEIFVEITAQVPAPHTLSQSTKLTFTAETWAAVQAAMLAAYPDWSRWLTPLVVGATLVAAGVLALGRLSQRWGRHVAVGAAALGVVALLAAPTARDVFPVRLPRRPPDQ